MAQNCKFYKEKKQVSYDNGVTFVDVVPAEYRKGELIERASPDCGYIPSSPKLSAHYSDSTTYTVECNSSTTLSRTEVTGHSTPYSSMTSAEIGDCVTIIGNTAFNGCTGLTSCTIGSGVTSIGYDAFSACRRLTSIEIPSGVTSIGSNAFAQCYGLTSIEIPSGVTSIGNMAFNWCDNLTSITVNAITPPTLGTNVFNNTNECLIYVPAASVETYKSAIRWNTYSDRIRAIPS